MSANQLMSVEAIAESLQLGDMTRRRGVEEINALISSVRADERARVLAKFETLGGSWQEPPKPSGAEAWYSAHGRCHRELCKLIEEIEEAS